MHIVCHKHEEGKDMAEYSIIADVSQLIVKQLQQLLVPDIVAGNDKVGLCSPSDRNDIVMGIFLYDLAESEDISRSTMSTAGISNRLKFPPIYMNLFYMITPYFTGNVRYKTTSEQEALGKIIQFYHDYPLIPIDEVNNEDTDGIDLRVELLRLSMEEKSKIWIFPDEPYRTSLFYKVSPVMIGSSRYRDVTRVAHADISVKNVNEQ
jgi:hypothetical protein